MIESRRRLLTMLACATGVLAAEPILAGAQSTYRRPLQPKPSSSTPDQHYPVRLDDPNATPDSSKSAQTQKELRSGIARLYELVAELKEQVDKTDATATLSLSVVKKAQEIEKLAKQIKDRAKS